MKHHYLLNKVKAKYTLLTENQDSIKAEVIKFRFKSVVKLGLSVGNMTKSANFLIMENHELNFFIIIDKYLMPGTVRGSHRQEADIKGWESSLNLPHPPP